MGFSRKQAIGLMIVIGLVGSSIILVTVTRKTWVELLGGPKLSLEMLMTGRADVVLGTEIGTVATYKMYWDNSEIGFYEMEATEIIAFQGTECLKAEYTISYSVLGHEYNMTGYGLTDAEDRIRYWVIYESYGGMTEREMTESTWDYDEGKMREVIVSADGRILENKEQTIPEFWDPEKEVENLYVGYSESFTVYEDNHSYLFRVNVVREENVTVPKGTFHCYVAEITFRGPESTYWIDMQGVVDQVEIDLSRFYENEAGVVGIFAMKLERYGIYR